jgi:adenine deaminase
MSASVLKQYIEASLGKRRLTLFLKRATLLNVFTGELYEASIGVYKDRIVYVGSAEREAERTLDASSFVAVPGFIDTHMHIESTMLTPFRFAQAVLPHGTTSVYADPHEIANVLGKEGVKMMAENARFLPLRFNFYCPTCVPESNAVTAGAELKPEDIKELLDSSLACALGEVMDYPAVLSTEQKMLEILKLARETPLVVDGHSPLLSVDELNAYVTAGPEADHENFTTESALQKLRLGMFVKLRGSEILDVPRFVSMIKSLKSAPNILFCTDDLMPDTLYEKGHLDYICRSFVEHGLDPVEAVRSVTLRAAQHMRNHEIGAISPGRLADIVLLRSLEHFEVDSVIVDGELVVHKRAFVRELPKKQFEKSAQKSVKLRELKEDDFEVKPPVKDGQIVVRTIEFGSGGSDAGMGYLNTIVTSFGRASLRVKQGEIILDDSVAYAFVFERHGKGGGSSYGFVKLLKEGALATTVSHDSHNLVVVGKNKKDMVNAANALIRCGGGFAASKGGELLALLELPIAGLMSEESVELVAKKMKGLRRAFLELGAPDHPYMPLISMLSLSVIPHARITNKGVYDVDRQSFVDPIIEVREE